MDLTLTPLSDLKTVELAEAATSMVQASDLRTMLEQAQALAVNSPDTRALGDGEWIRAGQIGKALVDGRMTITRPMDAAKKAVMDLFARPLELVAEVQRIYRQKISHYDLQVELEKKREQVRQAAISRLEEERQAEEARIARADAERLRVQAEAARQTGDPEHAAILEQSKQADATAVTATNAEPPPVLRVAEPPKQKGASYTRVDWLHEITDAAAVPREYLVVDEKRIAGIAKATKGPSNIPGVRFYSVAVPVRGRG